MNLTKKIPNAVIRRIPRYYRFLSALLQMGISRISSKDLGKRMEITSSQVRQDFYCFGGFGLQGYGYEVDNLHKEMRKILGLEEEYKLIVIGAGNLGQALVKHSEFEKLGFRVIGVFDVSSRLIGEKIRDIEIMNMNTLPEFVKQNCVDIAAITVPGSVAYEALDTVINQGIKAVWNFAPVELKVPKDVAVENIHLSDSLMVLGYRLKELRQQKSKANVKNENQA